jgi:hypothetical protein
VNVLVTNATTGEVGTATVDVNIGTGGGQGPHREGAPGHRKSGTPTGPRRSKGTHPGGPPGDRTTGGASPTGGPGSRASDASATRGSASHHRGAASRRARAATRRSPQRSKPRSSPLKPAVPLGRLAPVVSGLLISDVRPLPPGASPLVNQAPAPPAPAPALRSGGGISPIPALAGALCLAALFAYGAARELRGQRGGAVQGSLT